MTTLKRLGGPPLPFETDIFEDDLISQQLERHCLPVRFPPFPEELLSSWMVRLAWSNAEKLHTFKKRFWMKASSPWGQNIDLFLPDDAFLRLTEISKVSSERLQQHSLNIFSGILFDQSQPHGRTRGLLTHEHRGRQLIGRALQLCPECMREGECPYFRLQWRISFVAVCTKHNCILIDECPACKQPISTHLGDAGRRLLPLLPPTSFCSNCNLNWIDVPREKKQLDPDFKNWLCDLQVALNERWTMHDGYPLFSLSYFSGLNFLLSLLLSGSSSRRLHNTVSERLGLLDLSPKCGSSRFGFDSLAIGDRIYVLGLLFWLLQDWPDRLIQVLHDAKLRYSILDGYRENETITYWLYQHLFKLKDWKHLPISADERDSVRIFLRNHNLPVNPNRINSWLGRWYVSRKKSL